MAEVEPRASMNDCIDTIRRGEGRTVLHTSELMDSLGSLEVMSEKPRDLELIMDLLHHKQERVAHDRQKFFLVRESVTSYVYLASVKAI